MPQQPLPFDRYFFHFVKPELLPPPFELHNVTYHPIKFLAMGSNGIVWQFSDRNNNLVLLKGEFFNSQSNSPPSYTTGHEYQNEAIINKIIHGIGDFSGDPDVTDKPHFITMKYLPGVLLADKLTELFEQIREDEALQSSELDTEDFFYRHSAIWKLYIHFACAIHNMHLAGYAHLDLNCSNAIVSPDNAGVKLIDFGFSEKLLTPRKMCFFPREQRRGSLHLPPEFFRSRFASQTPITIDVSQDAFSFGFHLLLVSNGLKKLFKCNVLEKIISIGSDLQAIDVKNRMSLLAAIQQLVPIFFKPPISSPVLHSIAFELLLAIFRDRLIILNNISQNAETPDTEKNFLHRLIRLTEFLESENHSTEHSRILLSQLNGVNLPQNHIFFCANHIANPLLMRTKTAPNPDAFNVGEHVQTSLAPAT